MDVRMPMITSERDGDLMTRRPAAIVTSEHTLKIEAARAGVGVGEYRARLRQGLLWCYRCQDWHQADAFPADDIGFVARRHDRHHSRPARRRRRLVAIVALARPPEQAPPGEQIGPGSEARATDEANPAHVRRPASRNHARASRRAST